MTILLKTALASDNFAKSFLYLMFYKASPCKIWGRHGRDRMVIGFTTTYAISAYHH